jgi:hypothetical protein
MPEPEDSMRAACDALLTGDVFTAMGFLTPDAIAEVMAMNTGVTNLPTLYGYSIDSSEAQDGEQRYRVKFDTTQGDVFARATWRQVDGAWRITALAIEQP